MPTSGYKQEIPMPTHTQRDAELPDDMLDRALASCLVAPQTPAGFRNRVLATILTEQLQEVAQRRQQMEQEHAQELLRLRKGHVLLKRDTLALVAASAFAAGTSVVVALPWLHNQFDLDSALTGPLLALLIGVATGASVWSERFGKSGTLSGNVRQ
jgi:hypothetical protein